MVCNSIGSYLSWTDPHGFGKRMLHRSQGEPALTNVLRAYSGRMIYLIRHTYGGSS